MNDQKTGFFSVIGETNAGKSTLVNMLVKNKVSIVTHKVQTTQSNTMGVYTEGNNQLILVDTPGLFYSKTNIGSDILKETWNEIYDADHIMVILDASRKNFDRSIKILEKIKGKDIILVFNKIDKVKKTALPAIIDEFSKQFGISDIFLVSALLNDGIDDLRKHLLSKCTSEDWAFDEGVISNMPFEKFASEITREKVYELLHKEIPYYCEVETKKIDGQNIYQTIYIKKASHKPIIIGKNGSKIREIGTSARMELSILSRKNYNLFLNVELIVKH